MTGTSKVGGLVLVVWLLGSATAFAHSNATGIVKHRMEAMSDIAKNMRLIAAIMTQEKPFSSATVKQAALTIADHAMKIPAYFPEGSNAKPSETLPVVWTDWDTFTRIASDLATGARSLAAIAGTASNGPDIRAPFVALTLTCRSCHDTFRIKK